MTDPVIDHRALAVSYFNRAWELIDATDRTAEQNRDLLSAAFASRQHWLDGPATPKNLVIADWQVAHAASLAGLSDTALMFARAAVDRAETSDLPLWLKASTHEGLARAHAVAGDRTRYDQEAARATELLAEEDDEANKAPILSQLASIVVPD